MANVVRFSPVLLVLLLSLPALPQPSQTSSVERGVVVEEVQKGSEAEKAGLQAGDVILTWSRSDLHGNIESPFDLTEVEIEQNPRGSVLLDGLRGREKQIWRMGPDAWRVVSRPTLPADLLRTYQQCQKLMKAGSLGEAAECLHPAASLFQKSNQAWLGPWLLSRAAEWRAKAKQWKEADETYGEAIERASSAGPKVAAQLLQAWGDTFNTRRAWERAEECYSRSITESHRLASSVLTVGLSINSIGNVALRSGNFAKADEYYRKALAIRKEFAPGSLQLAGTIFNLGLVAQDLGDLVKAEDYYRQSLTIRQKLAPGSLDVAATLNSLGLVIHSRGDLVLNCINTFV